MKTLLLIDANSLIHRAFHALPPLTTPRGEPSGALYGLSSIFLKLFREEKPDYVAACFDRPEPTFRDEMYAEYKAKRPVAPEPLVSQLIAAPDVFHAFGIMTCDAIGFEADDGIATLVHRFKKIPDLRIEILTGDRDTLQLVEEDRIVVLAPKKGISDVVRYTQAKVREEYGIESSQLIDYKALVGDASDNIPGVLGIGPKTAQIIIAKYGSLDKALKAKGDKLVEEKLLPNIKDAEFARSLVILRTDAPIPCENLDDLALKEDQKKISAYFEHMGFKTLAKRLEDGSKEKHIPKKIAQAMF